MLKVPKSNSALQDALHHIRPVLAPEAIVVSAGMDKHLAKSVTDTLEEVIGPTKRCRATKRARHLVSEFDAALDVGLNPWPLSWRAHGATLVNHGGGFSPTKLDIGTGFLLNNVADFCELVEPGGDTLRMVDLGCGNGVIGLRVAQDAIGRGQPVSVTAIDDSALAIAATTASWVQTGLDDSASIVTAHEHRMTSVIDPESVDLVVVNPPFHEDHTISDDTAWSMFVAARGVLVPGGALVVVGNRHLAYHAKLAKIFGGTEVLASNKKFVAHLARRS